jgi:redox-sensitive bicupin YhaK (pirin superfamily)
MIDLRPFDSLGRFDNDWLTARHHFSFGHYYDPRRMGVGPLRVWNDDTIRPGTGFDPHPHRDMEIITYVRAGAITHQDSQGNRGRTAAGDVQVMSAGTGILHAEYNLEDQPTQIFQIWIEPNRTGLAPAWAARPFPKGDRAGRLVALASGRAGDDGALPIHQDAALFAATLAPGQTVRHDLAGGRRAYLVPARGRVTVDGVDVPARTGAAISDLDAIDIAADEESEVLLVDLP